LRLCGKGALCFGEGKAGDALAEIAIHLIGFSLATPTIHVDLPVTLAEAVLGLASEYRQLRGPSC
jgi:hypothetical protein